MAEFGPWTITARNEAQAEYIVRSRAEQRGLRLTTVEVSGGTGGMWLVSVTTDAPADSAAARSLGEDTQVLHVGGHSSRSGTTNGGAAQ